MKTTFIQQLPTLLIEKITYELQNLYVRACSFEQKDILDSALNSRLCDLEDTLDTNKYIEESKFWDEIGREFGEFEFGDTVWDIDGNCLLILRNTNKQKSYLSIEDATSMYLKDELHSIAIDGLVLFFGNKVVQMY
ncbi:hypothetical protein [Psychrobacillus sp. FSL H8-0510]|uniref:hypothetical protein n=1 Tax=Psychrobacillus sp. FSL H8-0510 TaxID=2921394 RepID=UPI0030F9D414